MLSTCVCHSYTHTGKPAMCVSPWFFLTQCFCQTQGSGSVESANQEWRVDPMVAWKFTWARHLDTKSYQKWPQNSICRSRLNKLDPQFLKVFLKGKKVWEIRGTCSYREERPEKMGKMGANRSSFPSPYPIQKSLRLRPEDRIWRSFHPFHWLQNHADSWYLTQFFQLLR